MLPDYRSICRLVLLAASTAFLVGCAEDASAPSFATDSVRVAPLVDSVLATGQVATVTILLSYWINGVMGSMALLYRQGPKPTPVAA